MMLKATNLTKKYGVRIVLKDFTFRFPRTGLIAVVGPSGCGKTTLLNILSGLDGEYDGDCQYLQRSLHTLSEEERSHFRIANVGYVFQDFRLFNVETVKDNLFNVLEVLSTENREIQSRHVIDCLELVGMKEKAEANVNILSGGEKQRVAISRAIINNPPIVLCDEPTGSLDEENGLTVLKILRSIAFSRLVIVVSHDEKLVTPFCDLKIRLIDGAIADITTFPPPKKTKNIISVKSISKARAPIMPLRTIIRKSAAIIKTRKIRITVNNFMMSLGLLGIGLSIIMTSSIQDRIVEGFSSVIDDSRIVMSKKNSGQSVLNHYSASYENVLLIKKKYANYISDIGVSYAVNFEDFFKNRDELFISSTTYKIVLPRFSSRQFNDYLWLGDGRTDYIVYPRQLSDLANDEMIIGLAHNDMIGLCYSLKIERSYASLGEYFRTANVLVTFSIANDDWFYDDEQVFRLSGVVESDEPTIYHTNHRWNEWVFEEKMRLPSLDGGDRQFQWQIYKTYY
ncbi:MAG: ATP-binding cassette domain-containing protein, partial [Bacilli bacterium]